MERKIETEELSHLVTHLEISRTCLTSLSSSLEFKPSQNIVIKEVKNIDLQFYWYLFNGVGTPYRWTSRKLLTNQQVLNILSDPTTRIFVIEELGSPAGFIELSCQNDAVECVYFGILPQFYGKKLGRTLFKWTMKQIFDDPQIQRFWLHTCEFDHPKAIDIYRSFGMTIKKQSYETSQIVKIDK